MKISVVTPSYNSAAYIERAILSVVSQNYDNYEHIIIDAKSNDGTVDILKKYSHLKWISETDTGQSNALNKGFKLATGDVIAWLNADEEYCTGAFKKVIDKIDEVGGDVIYGNFISIHENKEKYNKSIPFVKDLINFRQYVNTCTLFITRNIIDEGNILNEKLHVAMDKEYLSRLEKKGYKFHYLNEYLGKFYWHKENKSVKNRRLQIREGREIIKHLFFNNNELYFYLFFWPIKYYFDLIYKIRKNF